MTMRAQTNIQIAVNWPLREELTSLILGQSLAAEIRGGHCSSSRALPPATIFIPRPATSRRRCCAVFPKPKRRALTEFVVWGSGTPRREFLYVDDLADAVLHFLRHYSGDSHINIGAGYDLTIAEFAEHIKRCVGFERRVVYDRSRPDGTPGKLLDSSRIQALGWSATTALEEGLRLYYAWFLSNPGKLRETVIEAAISD
jgi:nucleoside-diphosphate-sugar epimerase